ncbi:TadE-like protein [Oceanobacillus limi]|uniref:TadE-like protein n=1 Tax=Oceanobacillus limi TaxID=930131 RepID=A0A1I0BGN7_9BACI|nr:TadE family protein [Oceanobacillus limi]SET06038.1 TadE-like protein [Oceanobacillus limi]
MIRKQDGQSLVEFALVIPIFLLLLVGIFDFGRIFYTHLQLEFVSQEAVRMAGLGYGDEAVTAYTMNELPSKNGELEITVTPTEANRTSGKYVTVKLAYPEEFFNVLGGLAIPYTVETSSTIRVE